MLYGIAGAVATVSAPFSSSVSPLSMFAIETEMHQEDRVASDEPCIIGEGGGRADRGSDNHPRSAGTPAPSLIFWYEM